ncbi:ATP-binding protein [Candidatus Woesearchaeota archaeon]|nr:ATP-binding protein [Candidatus Woesearchaeota archaeon]
MLLGTIDGRITTSKFSFVAKEEPKNFEYVQVYHPVYDFVLCQIIEVTKTEGKTMAACQVIGYKEQERVKRPRIPFEPGSEVFRAEDDFVARVIALPSASDGRSPHAVLGHLDGRTLPVALDLNAMMTKHVAVLAKSGAGKSYTVGVLLEEIAERGVPLVIVDPHGEYGRLAEPNPDEADRERMAAYGVEPKAYPVAEYGDDRFVPGVRPLRISTRLSAAELAHLLPGKLSANQQAVLYAALKNLDDVTFDSLLYELEAEESPAKYNIISTVDYLRSLPFFSAAPTPYNELVKPGQATVINLKGVSPDVQEIIIYKLCKDLFLLRKQNKVSPFFLVIEEAHNYCPERSFGETKASKVLRDIASEGRKFGLGLCVVSQRPARVDKSVLSQCSTQVILKVTNPNDLRAIGQSVEGITAEAEQEIQNLPVGTALITGATDVPLFVVVRPRRTAHGGHAVDMLKGDAPVADDGLLEQASSFQSQELLPLIKPSVTPRDLEVMSEQPLSRVDTVLIPAYQLRCREGEQRYHLLVEREHGAIVTDKESFETKRLPELHKLSPRELSLLQSVFSGKASTVQSLAAAVGGSVAIDDELRPLLEQGYVFRDGDALRVDEGFVFTRLSKAATYASIEYEQLAYQEKRPARLSIDDLKERFSRFTTVEDYHDCFVVLYEPVAAGGGSP